VTYFVLLSEPISHHTVRSVITAHNLALQSGLTAGTHLTSVYHTHVPAEHTANPSQEISMFHHRLDCIIPSYIHIIHSGQ